MDDLFLDGALNILETVCREIGATLMSEAEIFEGLRKVTTEKNDVMKVIRPLTPREKDLFRYDFAIQMRKGELARSLMNEGRQAWEEVKGGPLFPLAEKIAEDVREQFTKHINWSLVQEGHPPTSLAAFRTVDGVPCLVFVDPIKSLKDGSQVVTALEMIKALFKTAMPDEQDHPQVDVPTVVTAVDQFDLASWNPGKKVVN